MSSISPNLLTNKTVKPFVKAHGFYPELNLEAVSKAV
jgi:hypothetical protein